MILPHRDPECPGPWTMEWSGDEIFWRCDGCGAIAYHNNAVAEAAVRENELRGTACSG